MLAGGLSGAPKDSQVRLQKSQKSGEKDANR